MKKRQYSSNEFFIEHPDGSRTDAELHEPILAEGEAEAKKRASARLKAKGRAQEEIDNWLGSDNERADSKSTAREDQQRRADLIRFYLIMETLQRKIGGVRK